MKKKEKAIIITLGVVSGVVLTIIASPVIAANIVFNNIFKWSNQDNTLRCGLIDFSRVSTSYSREEICFESQGHKLEGFIYNQNDSEKMIIFSPGVHSLADDYISQLLYFVDEGFSVFSYNYSGVGSSEGISRGFPEGIYNLNDAINYIKSSDSLKNKELYLLGYSWGGYCSAHVLGNENIKAAATIAGVNNNETSILALSEAYLGSLLVNTTQGYVKTYQRNHFGELSYKNAYEAINEADKPILVCQGLEDTIARIDVDAIYKYRDEITNDKVEYKTFDGPNSDHLNILYSDNANEYRKEINNELDKKNADEKREYVKAVNHKLYSEPNEILLKSIADFCKKY